MSGNIIKRPAALQDLGEAADYIRRQGGPDRAIAFLREANATFGRLAGMPGMGALYRPEDRSFDGLRFFPLSRFRMHLVFYRPVAEGIEILRVLHGARDLPGLLSDGDDFPEERA